MNTKKLFSNTTGIGILSLSAFLLTSCGGKDAGIVGSCSFAASFSICSDYSTGSATDLETACTVASGTWATSACSATDRVGKCTTTEDGQTSIVSYYSTGALTFTEETAQASCTADSGTWAAEL